MKINFSFPKFLSIQTTSLCNGNCIFCPYKDIKDLFPKKIMDIDLYAKIIDECSNYKHIERIILYMNNEPLTDPHLIERINYAKEKIPWANVHILTNGSLLSEKLSQDLINSKLDWIGFSLHGVRKETIEKAMGLPYELTFRRVSRFIERAKLKKSIEDYIMVTFLKHKYLSLEEKDETIKYWQNKGIERISYFDGPVSRAGNVKNSPQVKHTKIRGCNSIWWDEMVHIVEDGKVILCCMDWRREVILGNVRKQSIYEIWNGENYQDIRKMVSGEQDSPDDFICKRCEEAITCEENKLFPKSGLDIEFAPLEKDANQVGGKPLSAQTVREQSSLTGFIDKGLETSKDKHIQDLVIINLPPWSQENPHIGIAYLGSYLRHKGYKMGIMDLNKKFYLNQPDFKMLWHVENKNFWSNENTFPLILEIFKKDMDETIDEVLSLDCNILGFSVVDPKERLTIEFIKRIKQKAPNKKIILGGPATSTYEQRKIFLDNIGGFIDAFVIGEGEETLFHLVNRFLDKKEIKDVEGCYVKNNGKWTYKQRLSINPLDRVPFPTYEEFDLSLYGKSLLVEWSRGCVGRCSFCKNYRLSLGYRMKKAKDAVDELSYHVGKNGITEFTVSDSLFNGDLQELSKLCDLIIDKNLKIKWSGQIAPWCNMKFELFDKMKKAGCTTLQIGLESASDKVLRNMRKIYSSQDAERAIRRAKQAGIETEVFVMIGFPGEGEKEFQKTVNFIERNVSYIDTIKSINTLHLIAGTDVYENYRKYGMKKLPKENWHYSWKARGGNTYKIRRQRAERLLNLAYKLGITVRETNIAEGKESKLAKVTSFDKKTLIQEINQLSSLKINYPKIKRPAYKKLFLLFIFVYTLFISLYLWLLKKFKKIIVFGSEV